MALVSLIQFVIGKRFYIAAGRALRNGSTNMDVLVAVGNTASYIYSICALLYGKYSECLAKGKTFDAIKKLVELAPATALLVVKDKDPQSWSSAPIYHSQWLQTTISAIFQPIKPLILHKEIPLIQNCGFIIWDVVLFVARRSCSKSNKRYWNIHKSATSYAAVYAHKNLNLNLFLDLDEKLDAVKTILDGDDSPKEFMHCKWREDIIEMLEDFGQSYRVLAIAYNQLKFKTSDGTFPSGSLSSSDTSKTICSICHKRAIGQLKDENLKEGWNHHPKYSSEHSNIKFDRGNLGFDPSNKHGDECHELLSAGPCSMELKPELIHTQMEDRMTKFSTTEDAIMKIDDLELNQKTEDTSMISFKFDNLWSTLKYQTKLTQDNLHQLVELVQRNDEKRETIRRLRLKVETLKRENKALQISLSHSNAGSECDQPQISKTGGISTSKLYSTQPTVAYE
ncbi:unnamed protein product [Sphenostylis stenocarpa]|uniref:NAB domain-containing protein n=1 Tax=Sphenostylis stenocarpa TaxID=92480 RepID=A0AA86V893_9FABA|nr:unnamed protein product [Sphenostylis stenocarpa]